MALITFLCSMNIKYIITFFINLKIYSEGMEKSNPFERIP